MSLIRLSTNHTQIIANETSQLKHLLANRSFNDDIRVSVSPIDLAAPNPFSFFILKYNLLTLYVLSNPNGMKDIHEHLEQLSSWKCFLLARWCIRHCLYRTAIDLLQRLVGCVHLSIHQLWLETLMDICRAEERLQTAMTFHRSDAMDTDQNDLEKLCENLAESGSFYESSLIQMPVGQRTRIERMDGTLSLSLVNSFRHDSLTTSVSSIRHSISSVRTATFARRWCINSTSSFTCCTSTIWE